MIKKITEVNLTLYGRNLLQLCRRKKPNKHSPSVDF